MKINFPTLFKTSLHRYKFFFIFGNEPLVFERIISFLQKKFSASLQIQSEVDLWGTTVSEISLFKNVAEPSLTLVSNVSDKIINHLAHLKEGRFILTSEKARAHSKLVTYFTQDPSSLAIAAYASPLIPAEFESLITGLQLSLSFKGQLFKAYQDDPTGLLSALEKVRLYGDIPEDLFTAFIDVRSPSDDFAPLIHAFLLRDVKKVVETLSLLKSHDLISFLRALSRAFLTLFEILPFQKSPKTIVWQQVKPPVFFKDQTLYEAALLRWNKEDIQIFLETLLTLELKVKHSAYAPPQVGQLLLKLLTPRRFYNSESPKPF